MNEDNLQEKFFNNKCSKEEAEKFLRWHLSDSGEEEIEKQIEKYWFNSEHAEWDSAAVFNNIQAVKEKSDLFVSHTSKSNSAKDDPRQLGKSNLLFRYWYATAAIFLITVGFAYNLINLANSAPVQTEVLAINTIEKSNLSGQKSTIHLKDGSRITLNSESKISYPSEFSSTERVISLTGEAYFEVAKDATRPFRVKTTNTVTTALGTAFNINAFEDEDEVKIGLASGRIKVKQIDNNNTYTILELEPGQGITYSKSKRKMVQTKVDIENIKAWTTKELIFVDEDFNHVIRKLERWFGVEIVVKNKVDGNFSASFKNESLKNVLEGISYSFSLDYIISNKNVMLKSKK